MASKGLIAGIVVGGVAVAGAAVGLGVAYSGKTAEYQVNIVSELESAEFDGAGKYKVGQEVELSAQDVEGYRFVYWQLPNEETATENPYKFTLTKENYGTYIAVYEKEYTITVGDFAHGQVTADRPVAITGEEVTLTVTADEHYYLSSITYTTEEGSQAIGYSNGYKFLMPAEDVTIVANFAEIEYTANRAVTQNGNITLSNEGGVYGDEISVSVNPNAGYEIDELYYIAEGSTQHVAITNNKFTLTGNVTVYATFKLIDYTMSSIPNQVIVRKGTEIITSASILHYGDELTISYTETTGYHETLFSVTGATLKQGETNVYVVNGNVTITYAEEINTYAVTLTEGTGYTLEAIGEVDLTAVEHGTNVQFTLTLDEAYTQSTPVVKANGNVIEANQDVYTITVTEAVTITVEGVEINTYTITFQDEDGTEISSETYNHGDEVQVPADPSKASTAEYTYTFAGWDAEVTTANGDKTYTATYTQTKNKYAVTLTEGTGYTLAKVGEVNLTEVEYGTNVQFTLTLDEAYTQSTPVVKSNGSAVEANQGVYTITVTGAVTITVEDVAINTYTVTFYDEDRETILDTQTIDYGEDVEYAGDELVKAADETYTYAFEKWVDVDGNDVSLENITENIVVYAQYEETYIQYNINISNAEHGQVSLKVDGKENAHNQETVEVEVTPEVHYALSRLYYVTNGETTENEIENFAFVMPAKEITIYAEFEAISYNATIATGIENGEIYVVPTTGTFGTEIVVNVNPDVGYELDELYYVEDGQTSQNDINEETKTFALSGDVVVYATFKQIEYTIGEIPTQVTIKKNNISLTSQNTLHYGDEITITYTETTGYHETLFSVTGATLKQGETNVYVVNGNVAVTYDEEINKYAVTLTSGTGYTLTKVGEVDLQAVEYGTEVEFTLTLNEGYTQSTPLVKANENIITATNDVYTITVTGTVTITVEGVAINTYTITFQDEDGTEISSATYNHGATVNVPANPTKEADETYTYTFAGWDADVITANADKTYTATYTSEYIDYTIRFVNEGTEISSTTYHYGDEVQVPADPSKASTAEYTYTFAGWDAEVTTANGDKTYTATYTQTKNKYAVSFPEGVTVNDGINDLTTGDEVEYGTALTISYTLTEGYHLTTFQVNGEDKENNANVEVQGAVSITFAEEINTYTVSKSNGSGYSVSAPTSATHGQTITITVTVESSYSQSLNNVTISGATKTGTNTSSRTVTFTKTITSNTSLTVSGVSINKYTVTFYGYNNQVLQTRTNVSHGSSVSYTGSTPTRAEDDTYTYTFSSWNRSLSNITSNTSIYAQFNSTYKEYTLSFPAEVSVYNQTQGKSVTSGQTVHYNDILNLSYTPAEGYQAVIGVTGLTDLGNNSYQVTGNATITYSEEEIIYDAEYYEYLQFNSAASGSFGDDETIAERYGIDTETYPKESLAVAMLKSNYDSTTMTSTVAVPEGGILFVPRKVKMWVNYYDNSTSQWVSEQRVVYVVLGDIWEGIEDITSFEIDENNQFYTIENDILYTKDKKVMYVPGNKTTITIPSQTQSIMTKITNNVTSITVAEGNDRFSFVNNMLIETRTYQGVTSSGLIKAIVPNNVTTLEIPEGIEGMQDGAIAVSSQSSLETIYIPSSISQVSPACIQVPNLKNLYLFGESVKTPNFGGNPYANIEHIYVPASLLEAYKAEKITMWGYEQDNPWRTYFYDKLTAMPAYVSLSIPENIEVRRGDTVLSNGSKVFENETITIVSTKPEGIARVTGATKIGNTDNYTVTGPLTIEYYEPEVYEVTVSGTVTVLKNGVALTERYAYEGDTLTITYAGEGSLTLSGLERIGETNNYTVIGNVTISDGQGSSVTGATFNLTFDNGLVVKNFDQVVSSGITVTEGDVITVRLAEGSNSAWTYRVTGADRIGSTNHYIVTGDVYVKLIKSIYAITIPEGVTVMRGEEVLTSESEVYEDDELTITVEERPGIVASLVVSGAEQIGQTNAYRVTGNVTITVNESKVALALDFDSSVTVTRTGSNLSTSSDVFVDDILTIKPSLVKSGFVQTITVSGATKVDGTDYDYKVTGNVSISYSEMIDPYGTVNYEDVYNMSAMSSNIFNYNFDSTTMTASATYNYSSSYSSSSQIQVDTLVIPGRIKYNGQVYTVTTINSSNSYGCSDVGAKTLVIPNTITSIASGAFSYLYSVREVYNLSSSVTFTAEGTSEQNYGMPDVLAVYNSLNAERRIVKNNGLTYFINGVGGYELISVDSDVVVANLDSRTTRLRAPNSSAPPSTTEIPKLLSVILPANLTTIDSNFYFNIPKLYEVYNLAGIDLSQNSMFSSALVVHTQASETSIVTIENNIAYVKGLVTREQTYNSQYASYETTYSFTASENEWTAVEATDNSVSTLQFNAKTVAIGEYAFQSCTNLEDVTIPEGVTTIDRYAFSGCSSLMIIRLPETLTAINDGAFNSCTNLVEIFNDSDLTLTTGSWDNGGVAYYAKVIHGKGETTSCFENIGNVKYFRYGANLIAVKPLNTTMNRLEFATGTTQIGLGDTSMMYSTSSNGAFAGCKNLYTLVIPSTVTTIAGRPFNVSGSDSPSYGTSNAVPIIEIYNYSSMTESDITNYLGLSSSNITFHTTNEESVVVIDGNYVYKKNGEYLSLLYILDGSITTLRVGDSVSRLGNEYSSGAFENITKVISSENSVSFMSYTLPNLKEIYVRNSSLAENMRMDVAGYSKLIKIAVRNDISMMDTPTGFTNYGTEIFEGETYNVYYKSQTGLTVNYSEDVSVTYNGNVVDSSMTFSTGDSIQISYSQEAGYDTTLVAEGVVKNGSSWVIVDNANISLIKAKSRYSITIPSEVSVSKDGSVLTGSSNLEYGDIIEIDIVSTPSSGKMAQLSVSGATKTGTNTYTVTGNVKISYNEILDPNGIVDETDLYYDAVMMSSYYSLSYNDSEKTVDVGYSFMSSPGMSEEDPAKDGLVIPSQIRHNGEVYTVTRVSSLYSNDAPFVIIPSTVTEISSYAFSGLYSMREVYNLSNVTIDTSANRYEGRQVAVYTSLDAERRVLEEDGIVYYINDQGNYEVVSVTGNVSPVVVLNDKTVKIRDRAFGSSQYSDGIYSITLPEGLQEIGMSNRIYSLVEIYNLSSLPLSYGSYDYGEIAADCSNIYTDLSTPSQLTLVNNVYYRNYNVPNDCRAVGLADKSVTSIEFDESTYSIDGMNFFRGLSLESLTISRNIQNISASFYYLNFLNTLIIDSSYFYSNSQWSYTDLLSMPQTIKISKEISLNSSHNYLNSSNFNIDSTSDSSYYIFTRINQ